MIEGSNMRICGMATCIICSEKAGIREDERNIRCPNHSKKDTTTSSNNDKPKDDTFEPDYDKVLQWVEALFENGEEI